MHLLRYIPILKFLHKYKINDKTMKDNASSILSLVKLVICCIFIKQYMPYIRLISETLRKKNDSKTPIYLLMKSFFFPNRGV